MSTITQASVGSFRHHLRNAEHAESTIKKYVREVSAFSLWLEADTLTKDAAIEYKEQLAVSRSVSGVNGAVAALNSYFAAITSDIRLNSLKTQARTFLPQEKELTRTEYERLIAAASTNGDERLKTILMTLGSTGIRISELQFVTVDAARDGYLEITNKGKTRRVPLPSKLIVCLKTYAERRDIVSGSVFVTSSGKLLDRKAVWDGMKNLCKAAKVEPSKVFPHNLRKLFARCFYERDKDVVRLADILGHSDVNTTRIYIAVTFEDMRRQIDELDLLG